MRLCVVSSCAAAGDLYLPRLSHRELACGIAADDAWRFIYYVIVVISTDCQIFRPCIGSLAALFMADAQNLNWRRLLRVYHFGKGERRASFLLAPRGDVAEIAISLVCWCIIIYTRSLLILPKKWCFMRWCRRRQCRRRKSSSMLAYAMRESQATLRRYAASTHNDGQTLTGYLMSS